MMFACQRCKLTHEEKDAEKRFTNEDGSTSVYCRNCVWGYSNRALRRANKKHACRSRDCKG